MHQHGAILALIATRLLPTLGLVGYDCGGEGLNITTLSLTDIAECHVEDVEPKTEEVYLQLMQLNEFGNTDALECRVEIDRTVYRCGMFSHVSAVSQGQHQYIVEVSGETCRKAQETGSILLTNNILLDRLKRNTTTARSLTIAGIIGNDGKCQGTVYSDQYGTWDNVIVQGSVKITLRNYVIPVKLSSNEVILPSGVRCKATDLECYNADGTLVHWKLEPKDSCNFDRYDVLFEGMAHKLTPPKGHPNAPVVYTVATTDATFALAKTRESSLCGYNIAHTEHPKLFLLETVRGRTFKEQAQVAIDNLDIFTYVNSKFVYVERHMRTQLTRMYKDIMSQKCALEKQILENALSLSSIAPDEMAHRLMKSPGYTAVTAGEVLYIIKCIPVTCRVRPMDGCYNELPVSHNNISYFLTPRSRILTKTGTIRSCNELLPPMYHIQDTWYRMMPKPVESLPPPIIRPLTTPTWKYVSPSNLAVSGIYTADDLDRLRSHIMFPIEKPALLNTVAHGAMGMKIPPGSVSIANLLDEESLEKIAENTGARLWKGFITFGSASAGILTIFLIIRVIKLIIDSIIRGYAIHSIYGWSVHLLGAIWSSLTHLLIHLGARKKETTKGDIEEASAPREPLIQPTTGGMNETRPGNERREEPISISAVRDYGELNKYLSATTKL